MKKLGPHLTALSLIIILLIPCYASADRGISVRPISPSGTEVKGNQWLFVIGIDTYINWPRMETAVNDAKSIKDVLLSRYHFDKDHLIELYDEQATRKNILGQLRFLAQKIGQHDSLVIFYAGHGHLDSITKEGSWIPVESGIKDTSAWITNHDIKNYMKVDAIKAKHILLISDSCFAGDFFRGHRGKLPKVTEAVIKKAYQLSSRQAITSGGLEPVSDAGFGKNSVFSHFLIKTLKENQKPFSVPSDLFPDIKAGVAENAEQLPRFGSLKDTGGQQGGELVLFLKQKSRLKNLSAATSKKSEEFKRLRKLEAEAKAAKKKEEAEIAKQERELTALDAKIAEMKKRLGTVAADTDDSLDAMYAMVQQKEEQQRHLDELKQKREAEEARRRTEIARLKKEKKAQRIAAIKADIAKYEKIVSSPFGKDMKEAAWKSLTEKYPEAKDLDVGDVGALRSKTGVLESTAKKGKIVAYENNVILDIDTGLEWYAGPDRKTDWNEAKQWVENLSIAGGGWRMPTIKELKTLYKKGAGERNITPLLKTTGWYVWSGETNGPSSACLFLFSAGMRYWGDRSISGTTRAFAVRSRKRGIAVEKRPTTEPEKPAKETLEYASINSEKIKKSFPKQIRASHILIKLIFPQDKQETAKAMKKIKDIQQKLRDGEDFATLAYQFSEGPSRAKGGDLGYFGRGIMVKSFEDEAFKLNIGEVSGIVRTTFGFHLIKVTEQKF